VNFEKKLRIAGHHPQNVPLGSTWCAHYYCVTCGGLFFYNGDRMYVYGNTFNCIEDTYIDDTVFEDRPAPQEHNAEIADAIPTCNEICVRDIIQ